MSTASTFTQRLRMADISDPAKSVGAHLAAKLELFCTDERTLTDELCDMLCIWLGIQAVHGASPSGGPSFDLTVSKTTTAEEVKTGADLELIVRSPLGVKRCLIQAKVLDPGTNKLRCASKQGFAKLRKQLVDARNEAGDLAFLLVYVPMNQLDGASYGYGTYEQGGVSPGKASVPSFFGATLIPVDDLIGKSNRWLNRRDKVPRLATGQFKSGIPFWRALLQLMLCRRGKWSSHHDRLVVEGRPSFRTFAVAASHVEPGDWGEVERMADAFLTERDRGRDV